MMKIILGILAFLWHMRDIVTTSVVGPSCACTRIYAPVCGSDNVTYSNECTFNCTRDYYIKINAPAICINYSGECRKGCGCTKEYNPVCGSDGKTYPNKCFLDCQNKELEYNNKEKINVTCNGECPSSKSCICPRIFKPVCGSDGKTYSNKCILECENQKSTNSSSPLTVASDGECPEPCLCTLIYAPVCGEDGQTYASQCQLDCKNKELKRKGQPIISTVSNGECPEVVFCPLVYDPVCGSNNVTYSNKCFLNAASTENIRKNLPPVIIKNLGVCVASCICPAIYQPICGSDGNTYSSNCRLGCVILERQSNGQKPITVISDGKCPEDTCVCPAIYQQVCGSDGNTYSSNCALDCLNREREKNGFKPIAIISEGECPDNSCVCPDIYQPVCGSDGKTYASNCNLDCLNQDRQRNGEEPIIIIIDGECPEDTCVCPAIYQPVCGSDGNTYSSNCALDCLNRERENNCLEPIAIISEGECPDNSCVCPYIYQPVCGSDGNTYASNCNLDCLNKEREKNGEEPIIIISDGECPEDTCVCPAIYQPVCGSDGNTYSSNCALDCLNRERENNCLEPIAIISEGECPDNSCVCPYIYQPVCGSDGNTYASNCNLDCLNKERQKNGKKPILKISDGECSDNSCFCPYNYLPVCGSDGQTYPNECSLKCASKNNINNNLPAIIIVNEGECSESCICLAIYQPVCGSDGQTYSNICTLNCKNDEIIQKGQPNITIIYEGECEESCFCPTVVDPVCGSNGQTYPNECLLECENKNLELEGLSSIEIRYKGVCKEPCDCYDTVIPVCGTNNKSFRNICYLNCSNTNRNVGDEPIRVQYNGTCQNCLCTLEYNPICGSDGNTYANICRLKCESRRLVKNGKLPLRVVHNGPCGECVCSDIYKPICASDNNTYRNKCELTCENKIRQRQNQKAYDILYKGKCERFDYNCDQCPLSYKPVCGNDGATYWNLCYLYCFNKCNNNKGTVKVTKNGCC